MSYEPLMDGKPATNVYTEHVYKIRATFAASSELTFRSKDATIAKTTTTTFTVTLPKPYAEITEFSVGSYAATGTAGLQYIITDKSTLATAGTLVLTSVDTNSAGTAAAPAAGDVAYITIGVSCDTLNDKFTG
jgi:hypothetical protein